MEALNTLEYIFVLQQAGKDAAMEREFDVEVPWPGINDVWPPTKYKLDEVLQPSHSPTERATCKSRCR